MGFGFFLFDFGCFIPGKKLCSFVYKIFEI